MGLQGGVYTGRKPPLTIEQVHQLRERATVSERKSAPAKEFNISRETVYSYLRATGTATVTG
jgi:DNA invertase Pin-like site-specific DNA recombinase